MEGIEYQVTDKIKTSFISPESYNTVSCFLGNLQTLQT